MANKIFLIIIGILFMTTAVSGQGINTKMGRCNSDVSWSFDGHTLTLSKNNRQKMLVSMPDYNLSINPAPWIKKNLPVRKVIIESGVNNIGACAFASCQELESVEFTSESSISEIGWGAFLRCKNLFNFSMPSCIKKIGKIAFAECTSLRSINIPEQARVEDYAFLSCSRLNVIDIAVNAMLGKAVFANEVRQGNTILHTFYRGEIRSLPANINADNSYAFGIERGAVEEFIKKQRPDLANADEATSDVDRDIPITAFTRNDTYALIIGNQHYRFAPDVPFALHDARIFAEYSRKTLGIPAEHIHLSEDATKTMLLEQEIGEWLKTEIDNKNKKKLIVYYAGHGAPDINDKNKAYLLPTDVRGTNPSQGIALDSFYSIIGSLGFQHVTVIMDACFSGINRDNESINNGERATEVEAQDAKPSIGNMVVFCAAQGNETAQGYLKEGHGLFTYYLLKELQSTDGNITNAKLAKSLEENVSKTAPSLDSRKKQTPMTRVSDTISDSWGKVAF